MPISPSTQIAALVPARHATSSALFTALSSRARPISGGARYSLVA
jgi:hypothetical protein